MRTTGAIWMLVVTGVAFSVLAAPPKRRAPASNPNAAVFARAKEAVANGLRDPLSAQFRELSIAVDGDGNRKVCGQVNSKNGYGGYVGFRGFAYLTELGQIVFAPEDDDAFKNSANRAGSGCSGFGTWTK